MKRALGILCCLALLLPGCWDANNIQDVNYVVAVGIDYEKGGYRAYAMLLDFSNVAKQEGGNRQPAPVWVGRGTGKTVGEALRSLYATSQQHMFWGHVASIVFSESMLRQGIESDFIDPVIRFRELRFTQWVYATKMPIEELFAVRPFFNLSPLSSILAEPTAVYRQEPDIRPLRLQRLMVDIREPGRTALLPSLNISKEVWKRNGKEDPKLYVDGVVAISGKRKTAWIPRSELPGLQWFDRRASNIALAVPVEAKKPQARVSLEEPKASASVRMDGETLVMDIRLDATGKIVELTENADTSAIPRQAEERIRQQIKDTFEHAQARDVDIYHMEHRLYRSDNARWRKVTRLGQAHPPRKLGRIEVHVRIGNSGMYKAKDLKSDY